jgi:LysM repeat protein
MTLRVILIRSLLLLPIGLTLTGCLPAAHNQSDEEKESHFLAGKSRVSTLDFKGAIESFERALEVNPHSAAAHFELGCLFEEPDPAAAIYHYEKYLKLRAEAPNGDVVKQRITTCKQELARNVSLGPLTERQQRDLEQLTIDNKALAEKVKSLGEELEKWRLYALSLQSLTNSGRAVGTRAIGIAPSPTSTPVMLSSLGSNSARNTSESTTALRTHTVRSGETLTTIARRYGVGLQALTQANPRVDPRRLQVGQTLAIPSP